jgi:hypothetical protein
MTSPSNRCGSCTQCCRVFAIPEFNKPAGKWCEHCAIGKGCKVYHERPARCVDFECLWLQADTRGQPLPAELRPDRCKVVFAPTTNERIMTAITMPGMPDAWQSKTVRGLIDRLLEGGIAVAIGPAAAQTQLVLHPDGTQRQVKMTEPDENGMIWSITPDAGPGEQPGPAARVGEPRSAGKPDR